jgi:hypothetical protein
MNVKKEVFAKMLEMVERELYKINQRLRNNANIINSAAKENTILKRQRVELIKQIREWKNV